MEKYIAIGIIVFIVLVLVFASVLVLCKASGEADKYAAQMMNENKKKIRRIKNEKHTTSPL